MRAAVTMMGANSRALSYVLGSGVLVLTAAVLYGAPDVAGIVAWTEKVLGVAFTLGILALAYVAILAWVKVSGGRADAPGHRTWFEAGIQAANAIATLALTYTLLGISLGIGTLSEQALTPQTVHAVIRDLTHYFSMAFMTTVVGLPLSTSLRTMLLVSYSRALERAGIAPASANGDER